MKDPGPFKATIDHNGYKPLHPTMSAGAFHRATDTLQDHLQHHGPVLTG